MNKAVIISGFLYNLSDNIIPFLDKDTTLCVHTWNTQDNARWINKLNRYKKYCKELSFVSEDLTDREKLMSYFYSTLQAFNLVKDNCDVVIKFKPNIDTEVIPYAGNLNKYYTKAKLQCRPILDSTDINSCIFGKTYYRTLDERIFSGTKLAFNKIFTTFNYKDALDLNRELKNEYGEGYEGSIFWTKFIESTGIKIIEDTDLIIANNREHEK